MKKHLLTVSLMALVYVVMSQALFAQPGLIGCFPLDNNTNDYSGYNNNGTATNLAGATNRFGNPNHAYHFSGNQSALFFDDSLYRLNTYTYSVWVKPNTLPSAGSYYCVMAIGGHISDQVINIGNNTGNGNIGFGIGSWDSLMADHSCYLGVLPAANQWYHIVFTRDADSLKLYVDDVLRCSNVTHVHAGYNGNPHGGCLGARHTTTSSNLIGDMDDVKIFNRALAASEIASIDTICASRTGINEPEDSPLSGCYFDPASLQIRFTYNNSLKDEIKAVEVYSIPGQLVFSTDIALTFIDAAYLSKGMYLVVVKSKNKNVSISKVVVY